MLHHRLTKAQSAPLVYGPNVKITVDGNSIYAGYASGTIASLIAARSEMVACGSIVSVAVSGHTWRKLNGLDGESAADVNAAISASGMINILVVGEGTNSAGTTGNRTGAQIVSDCAEYIAARRAVNPNLVVLLCSALPRTPTGGAAINTALNYSDFVEKNTFLSIGANKYANFRALPWAAHDGLTPSKFVDFESKWAAADGSGGTGIYVHPSLSGVNDMVSCIVDALLQIRASDVSVTP